MRYCVNCGSTAEDDARYCARCGYILRDRPEVAQPPLEVAQSPLEVTTSQAPEPVTFVSKTRSPSHSRNNGFSALGLGVIFILMGLFLGMIFLCPWFIGDIAHTFGSLGGKFGELGGEFGSAFGELGSKFGEMGGEFGSSFGGAFGNFGSRFGPTLIRVLLVVSILACFMIPGIIILVRSRQRNHSQNIRWD
jgi:hypothetical protein